MFSKPHVKGELQPIYFFLSFSFEMGKSQIPKA